MIDIKISAPSKSWKQIDTSLVKGSPLIEFRQLIYHYYEYHVKINNCRILYPTIIKEGSINNKIPSANSISPILDNAVAL